nr:guamerin [Hirudo nipponia]
MKTTILCCFFLASLLIVSGVDENAEDTHGLCGEKTCSAAQVCLNNECVCTAIRCMIFCPNGFKVDENGCEYPCTCA